jgi:hypothetical protein
MHMQLQCALHYSAISKAFRRARNWSTCSQHQNKANMACNHSHKLAHARISSVFSLPSPYISESCSQFVTCGAWSRTSLVAEAS